MAYTWTKIHDTGPMKLAKPGEVSTYVEVFHVVSDGGVSDPQTQHDVRVLSECPIPKITRFGGTSLYFPQQFVCASVDISHIKGAPHQWLVTVAWETRFGLTCWVKTSRFGSGRLAARFRDGNPLADGTAAWPPTATEQVTGTKLDYMGQPFQIMVPQQRIVVETMFDATALKVSTGSAIPDYQTINSTYAFKRNNAAFLGWAKGKVLFEGCSETGQDDIWRTITWNFLADDWFHLEQRPVLDINGKPITTAGSAWADGTVPLHCANVVWFQPFTGTAALSSLFDSCTSSEIASPTPANVAS